MRHFFTKASFKKVDKIILQGVGKKLHKLSLSFNNPNLVSNFNPLNINTYTKKELVDYCYDIIGRMVDEIQNCSVSTLIKIGSFYSKESLHTLLKENDSDLFDEIFDEIFDGVNYENYVEPFWESESDRIVYILSIISCELSISYYGFLFKEDKVNSLWLKRRNSKLLKMGHIETELFDDDFDLKAALNPKKGDS